MMEYVAPQKDMQFALKYLANMASISELPGFEAVSYTHLRAHET